MYVAMYIYVSTMYVMYVCVYVYVCIGVGSRGAPGAGAPPVFTVTP